ncbi:MAG: hypothetical protein QOH25_3284 [Acidobacteriota bacterium]|jgi:lactoylglutathione lyase|nr:hypothetical protein [Acidobacteriota bacterium]
MFKQLDYTVVTVSDMARSVEFYRDTLGLELRMESPEWTEFQTGATTFALHGGGVQQDGSKPAEIEKHYAGACSIGFNVEDIDKTFADLKSKGVSFMMPPVQREGESFKLAVCTDPDGLPITFAQISK